MFLENHFFLLFIHQHIVYLHLYHFLLAWNFRQWIHKSKMSFLYSHKCATCLVGSQWSVCLNCCKVNIEGKQLYFLDGYQHHSWGLTILWGTSPLVSVFIREKMHTCILLPFSDEDSMFSCRTSLGFSWCKFFTQPLPSMFIGSLVCSIFKQYRFFFFYILA